MKENPKPNDQVFTLKLNQVRARAALIIKKDIEVKANEKLAIRSGTSLAS